MVSRAGGGKLVRDQAPATRYKAGFVFSNIRAAKKHTLSHLDDRAEVGHIQSLGVDEILQWIRSFTA